MSVIAKVLALLVEEMEKVFILLVEEDGVSFKA